jgi:hypothetical protein
MPHQDAMQWMETKSKESLIILNFSARRSVAIFIPVVSIVVRDRVYLGIITQVVLKLLLIYSQSVATWSNANANKIFTNCFVRKKSELFWSSVDTKLTSNVIKEIAISFAMNQSLKPFQNAVIKLKRNVL